MQPEDVRNVEDLRTCKEAGTPLKMVLFWGHRPARDGAIGKTCFSQWFDAAFEDGDVTYLSAEHFMMAEKARLFADEAALARVLSAATPGAAKAAERAVQGFVNATWVERRWDIVVKANMLKFSQHPELRAFLLATGDRVLVEASPVDAIWGSAIAADDPAAEDPHAWTGLNLLGFALMAVRARLRG